MVRTYTKEVSGTQLVSGILGTVDIGATLAKALTFAQDLAKMEEQLTEARRYAKILGEDVPKLWLKYADLDADKIISEANKNFYADSLSIVNHIRDQIIASGGGFSMTAGGMAQRIKLLTAINPIDVWHDMTIGMPQQLLTEKVERYWRKKIMPNLPSDREVLMLIKSGTLQTVDLTNRKREIDGISTKDAEKLTDLLQWQYGKPSIRDTYLMVQKGLQNRAFFDDLVQKGYGFTKSESDLFYTHLSYDPSCGELLRLSDLIPLDSSWIDKKLIANGLDSEDRAIFKSGIEKRSIRDEVNKAWAIMQDSYQWGLFTETDLTTHLEEWKFSQAEIDIRVDTCNLIKDKLRLKLLRDAEVYLYRKGIIVESVPDTDEGLLERLVALGISFDISNAIVRNEASKKGIDWELAEE